MNKLIAIMGIIISVLSINTVYGQTEALFPDCISSMSRDSYVILESDDDCSDSEFEDAVEHYKANGYPVEESYGDFGSAGKLMSLYSQEFAN